MCGRLDEDIYIGVGICAKNDLGMQCDCMKLKWKSIIPTLARLPFIFNFELWIVIVKSTGLQNNSWLDILF